MATSCRGWTGTAQPKKSTPMPKASKATLRRWTSPVGGARPTASVPGVHIELEGPLPFAVDRLFVEPHGAGEQARVGREVPVETDPAAAEGVLAGGVVAGEDEAIELVPRCILNRCESTVEPDHEAGGFGLTLRVSQHLV